MYVHIPGWHTFVFRHCSSLIDTRWRRGHRWQSGQRWCRFGWRCTGVFAPPTCLPILCHAILASEAAVGKIFMNRCQVSFFRGLHLCLPWNCKTAVVICSKFSVSILDEVLHFPKCGARKPSFGYLALFEARHMSDCSGCTRPPSLPKWQRFWRPTRYELWLQNLRLGIPSTIYASVASSKIITACFVHSQAHLSQNLSPTIPELIISWCMMLRTVRTNAIFDHVGFLLRAVISQLRSSLRTPDV